MNTDKQYASRGLEGARRATARSVDESPFKHRLTPTSRERPAKPRGRRHGDASRRRTRCASCNGPMPVPWWGVWGPCFAPKDSTPRT